ncbi:MAG: hypothetical protein HYY06_03965 [Deltaproteobacteria bacterium]|nr:hypothetical protein [Deltaproteobacteria bacterium]
MRPRALPARRPMPGPARVRPNPRVDVAASRPGQRVDIAAAGPGAQPAEGIPERPSAPAALAAWAGALLGQIHGLEDRIGLDFYRVGQRLRLLHDPSVYQALGFRSFGQLLESHEVMSRYWATQLVRIATEYSAEQARTLGVSKAWAVISYAAATGQKPSEIVERNAAIDGTPLEAHSVRELQAAAARERARRKGLIGTQAHRDAERAARKISRTLRARGARDAHVRLLLRGSSWRIRVEVSAELAVAAIVGPTVRAVGAAGAASGAGGAGGAKGVSARGAIRAAGRAPPR